VNKLNEIEMADGFIYANRWTTDNIYKIDKNNGNVVNVYNMGQLISKQREYVQSTYDE